MSELYDVATTSQVKLRSYQEECVKKIMENIDDDSKKAGIVVLPTGTGKTVVGCSAIAQYINSSRKRGQKVVVITHRSEIAIQWHNTLKRFDVPSRIVMHTANASGHTGSLVAPVTICGIETIKHRKNLQEDLFGLTGLVVLDEAHHTGATGWYKFIKQCQERNNSMFMLGFTATPFRSDKKSVLAVLHNNIIYYMSILDAINNGWIVPLQQYLVRLEDEAPAKQIITASEEEEIRRKGVVPLELIRKLAKSPEIVAQIAHVISVTNADKQTIIYCIDVEHAYMVYEALKRYCPDGVGLVLGNTDASIRDYYMRSFVSCNLKWLVNCNVYTEGFDACHTQSIILLRPTRSVVLYNQCIGRGLRPLPGVVDGIEKAEERKKAIAESNKPSLYVCDFVGSCLYNKLVTSLHMVYGEQRKHAIDSYVEKNAVSYKEVTKDSKVMVTADDVRRIFSERVPTRLENTRYRRYIVNPFRHNYVREPDGKVIVANIDIPAMYISDLHKYFTYRYGTYRISSVPATVKQMNFLESLRLVPPPDVVEKFYGGAVIDKNLASILISCHKLQCASKRTSLLVAWAIMRITDLPISQVLSLPYYDAIMELRRLRAPWCRFVHDPYFLQQVNEARAYYHASPETARDSR